MVEASFERYGWLMEKHANGITARRKII